MNAKATPHKSTLREASTRRCYKCKIIQPPSNFFKDRTTVDGYCWRCKKCSVISARENYRKHKDKPEYQEKKRITSKKYEALHPERKRAHQAASRHRKELKKDVCEHCDATSNLHMHHPDYSKPLEVLTLCVPCHEKVHHSNDA